MDNISSGHIYVGTSYKGPLACCIYGLQGIKSIATCTYIYPRKQVIKDYIYQFTKTMNSMLSPGKIRVGHISNGHACVGTTSSIRLYARLRYSIFLCCTGVVES